MKAGTIGAYPEHSADIYTVRYTYPKDVRNNTGRLYLPPTGPKSMITNSVQDQNVLKSVTNFHICTVLKPNILTILVLTHVKDQIY